MAATERVGYRRAGQPSRRSLAEWTRLLDTCLRNLDRPIRLLRLPRVKLPDELRFAHRRHSNNTRGRVLAL